MAPTPSELQSIRRNVDDWRRLSDRLFQVGGLKVGLDGILTWFPGVGDAYGIAASAFLLERAARAGASSETITRMAVLLGVDAVIGSVPVAGDIFDFFFRAHARAADVLKDEIDRIEALALPAPEAYAAPSRGAGPRRPDIDLSTDGAQPPPPQRPAAAPAQPPAPHPRPAPPPPPVVDEETEWEQARRVEELRAQYRERGGSIDRSRR